MAATCGRAAWAASGVVHLTGRADGPPVVPPGDGALLAALLAGRFAALTGVRVDGPRLLSERAAFTGAGRRGNVSAGGSCRLLPTADGWAAVSCARPDDPLLLLALAGSSGGDLWTEVARWLREHTGADLAERAELLGVAAAPVAPAAGLLPPTPMTRETTGHTTDLLPGTGEDPDRTAGRLAGTRETTGHTTGLFAGTGEDPGRATGLFAGTGEGTGRAAGRLAGTGEDPGHATGPFAGTGETTGHTTDLFAGTGEDPGGAAGLFAGTGEGTGGAAGLFAGTGVGGRGGGLLVADFSALWAGPLCAHLLGLAGARVVKVETPSRPDGARRGNAGFYRLLHAGHRSVVLDPETREGRAGMAALVEAADVVIESSRPRALRRFGLDAEAAAANGTTWVSITAYGRSSDRVGFGDDVAAAAGLVAATGAGPLFCGDALADPLTGLAAAVLAAAAPPGGALLDIPMAAVAAAALGSGAPARPARHDGTRWVVDTPDGPVPVALPARRTARGTAPESGADTATVLGELGL